MNKILFGIFAHPDDEAFGPSGTLVKRVNDGEELHLVCVTKGQAGMNPGGHADLGTVREQEWRVAGERIGAAAMHNLGYEDGTLSNQYFHEIAGKIEAIINESRAVHQGPVELHFVTLDSNGLTGHLDHIAVSNITSYLFYRFKAKPLDQSKTGSLDYFCFSRQQVPQPDMGFVFMPAGRSESYITKTVDVSDVLEEKIAIMRLHHTQRGDAENILARGNELLMKEHFHTIS